ncbi:protein SKIP34 [Coffea arabica]|uniref:Protein SKIP34 n=1 Tax=Coffea arabica TaxID=13443 RepID=A0A6P6THA7_COFAR
MCYGGERLPSKEDFDVNGPTRPTTAAARLAAVNENEAVVENLRDRLAETEARLERARAREAELSRQLEEMKRFVSVMEILETYLKRRYREQQDQLCRLFSPVSAKSL